MTEYTEMEIRRGDDKIKRDRVGRYLLPDPETGEIKPYTRATTIANTLKDRWALELWDDCNIVYGIGQRRDLYLRAAAAPRDDDETLRDIAKQAKQAAASESAANIGSALHQFMERVDRGEDVPIPPPHDRDVEAYRKAMEAAGIVVAVGWIERVVFVPELNAGAGIVGMLDRLVNSLWPQPRIGDIKTTADDPDKPDKFVKYGSVDIPLQLAIYAHGACWWAGEKTGWVEMPKIDQRTAMVMHVPQGSGVCSIYEIDIEAGWEAVQLAFDIRAWRKRDDLFELIPVLPGPSAAIPVIGDASGGEPVAGDGTGEGSESGASGSSPSPTAEALRARVEAIKAHPQARQWLAARWPVGIPTFPKGGPTTEAELANIAEVIERTERQFEIAPGGAAEGEDEASTRNNMAGKDGEGRISRSEDPPAPASPSDNGDDQTDPRKDAGLATVIDAMDEDQRFRLRHQWLSDRINAIKTTEAEHDGVTPRKALAVLWSLRDEIPTFPKGGPRTDDELDAVIAMCDLVEMEFGMQFGPSDPTAPKATKQSRKESR